LLEEDMVRDVVKEEGRMCWERRSKRARREGSEEGRRVLRARMRREDASRSRGSVNWKCRNRTGI
jgi:hypothetical protein